MRVHLLALLLDGPYGGGGGDIAQSKSLALAKGSRGKGKGRPAGNCQQCDGCKAKKGCLALSNAKKWKTD